MFANLSFSQDTTFLKVHFLYGSKPAKEYRKSEKKWFGGIMGGHVGIEADTGKVVSFMHNGKFHVFERKNNRHSRYQVDSPDKFYSILGSPADSVKKATVYIPVILHQKEKFDSITGSYLEQTPYDYAFFGMRCSAAASEILGQLNILPQYGHARTYRKTFYPKKLRKRLLLLASENNWNVDREKGTARRKWERD